MFYIAVGLLIWSVLSMLMIVRVVAIFPVHIFFIMSMIFVAIGSILYLTGHKNV